MFASEIVCRAVLKNCNLTSFRKAERASPKMCGCRETKNVQCTRFCLDADVPGGCFYSHSYVLAVVDFSQIVISFFSFFFSGLPGPMQINGCSVASSFGCGSNMGTQNGPSAGHMDQNLQSLVSFCYPCLPKGKGKPEPWKPKGKPKGKGHPIGHARMAEGTPHLRLHQTEKPTERQGPCLPACIWLPDDFNYTYIYIVVDLFIYLFIYSFIYLYLYLYLYMYICRNSSSHTFTLGIVGMAFLVLFPAIAIEIAIVGQAVQELRAAL